MSKQQLYKDILTEVKVTYDLDQYKNFNEFYDAVEVTNFDSEVFVNNDLRSYYRKAYKVLGGNENPRAKVLGKILCTDCGVNCELYWCTIKRKKQILCADCSGAFND